MLSFRFAQYYVWVVLKTLYTINRHSYLRGFLVCPQSLGCRHDAEEGSQLVYIPQKLTGLRLFSLINDFFLVNLHSIILPWWWNGRHEGLKIPWTEMSVRVRFPPGAPYKELTDWFSAVSSFCVPIFADFLPIYGRFWRLGGICWLMSKIVLLPDSPVRKGETSSTPIYTTSNPQHLYLVLWQYLLQHT